MLMSGALFRSETATLEIYFLSRFGAAILVNIRLNSALRSLSSAWRINHEENPKSLVCDHGHSSSQCRDAFRAAVVSEFSDHHLQRHMQHDPTLPYQRVRLLLYHAAHWILHKEAGRSRACWEVASGEGSREGV